jgi:hypothetical protein
MPFFASNNRFGYAMNFGRIGRSFTALRRIVLQQPEA